MAAPHVSDGAASSRPHAAVRPEVAAEAAVWVARLHGPSRSPQMERECLAWQARSPEHREAFERCTETWQAVPGVTLDHAYAGAASVRAASGPGMSPPWRWAAALGLAVVLAGGALLLQQSRGRGVYETGVGEQQLVLLQDGTRLSLNTGTRVRVALDSSRRVVDVGGGRRCSRWRRTRNGPSSCAWRAARSRRWAPRSPCATRPMARPPPRGCWPSP